MWEHKHSVCNPLKLSNLKHQFFPAHRVCGSEIQKCHSGNDFYLLYEKFKELFSGLPSGVCAGEISLFENSGSGGLIAKSYLILVTPWIVAHQAPLSMGFPRQEYWSGLYSFSRGSSQPKDQAQVSCIADSILNWRWILDQLRHQGRAFWGHWYLSFR